MPARRIAQLLALAALALCPPVAQAAGAPARGSVRVFAPVPSPGYPALPHVVGDRVYEGTYDDPRGDHVPSRVFEYDRDGKLLRTFVVRGQDLSQPHGVQVAADDARGRLILLDKTSGRILRLNPRTGAQSTYAHVADLPTCGADGGREPCSPALVDQPPMPDYAAWGPDGSLYVTDYQQAVIWRIPPGGGEGRVWLADRRLDGAMFGTASIALAPDHRTLLFDQASNAGLGGGNPSTGKLYAVRIKPGGGPGPLRRLWESGPAEAPDGFALARSGHIYMALVGVSNQVVELDSDGRELARFGQRVSGANGSPVPFDSPSGVAFLGTELLIANQAYLSGDAANQALLALQTGEEGEPVFVPRRHRRRRRHHRRRQATAPALPLGHAGRWLTDGDGRVVVTHGVDQVAKYPPYVPAQSPGFDGDDAAFLARNGFDSVRLGVIWKAVEPRPGVYDDHYIARIAAAVRMLGRHGILSLLDFHQDMLNEKFGGEGWPDWAILDDGLPAQPLLGFPLSYGSSPGLNRAMGNFYANAPGPGGVGVQDRYAAAWRHVAQRFAQSPYVLGYDLMNEPWSGSAYFPSCVSPQGCSGVEQEMLAPMEARVMDAIRTVDRTHLLFYEPIVETQYGLSQYTIQNPTGDPRAGMSFHIYCLSADIPVPGHDCSKDEQASLDHAIARGKANGDALLETEWGATDDLALIDRMVVRHDRAMMPWMYWAYTGNDPTTSGGGGAQAIVKDPTKPPRGDNVKRTKLAHLVEPYPQLVAGTPQRWGFDAATEVFTASWSTRRAGGSGHFGRGALSEVFVPRLHYPRGYRVHVHGGRVVSRPGARRLTIAQRRGARTVEVRVTPKAPAQASGS